MEQGEGFERERIPPQPGSGIRGEPAARDVSAASREERYGLTELGSRLPARDLTRWSSVWAGFFVAVAVMVLVGVLGIGLGLTSGANAAIWTAVTLTVGFFCGGWFAARTSAVGGSNMGLIHGGAVWAVTTALLLVLGAFALAGALGIGGPGVLPMAPGAPVTPEGITATQAAGWGSFVALILGLIASLIGGLVGGMAYEPPARHRVP